MKDIEESPFRMGLRVGVALRVSFSTVSGALQEPWKTLPAQQCLSQTITLTEYR